MVCIGLVVYHNYVEADGVDRRDADNDGLILELCHDLMVENDGHRNYKDVSVIAVV